MRIRFHPAARDELREAAAWYERAMPGLGEQFHREVERILDVLSARAAPGLQVRTASGRAIERVFLNRFPYAIYFESLEEDCVIWAIAHGRRRPYYWRGRL